MNIIFKQVSNRIEWDRINLKRKVEHQVEDRWIINRLESKAKESFGVWDSILFLIINLSIHFSMQIRRYNEMVIFPLIIHNSLLLF